MPEFKKGDFVITVPFNEANLQIGQYINGMDKNDWPPYGIVQICNGNDTVIIEYDNDSWPVPVKFIKQKFSKRDKVNVIPWEDAIKTNLYNKCENRVYDIDEEDWFKFGIVMDFNGGDIEVSNVYEVWFSFPPEFLTIAN
jgi:hypothetical protein